MSPQWTSSLLNLTLRGGSVYYLQHRDLSSGEPHYFVVLNRDTTRDEILVLAVSSSNIAGTQQRSRNLPLNTLVEISPAEYPDFTKNSIVDCNYSFQVTKLELLQKLQMGLAREQLPMPEQILARLREGILASPLIENAIKSLLR